MLATDFYAMANLFPKTTGLPFIVWVSVKGGAKHDIRVKVSYSAKVTPKDLISVALRPTLRVVSKNGTMSSNDLQLLSLWVGMNKDVLLKYWNSEIDTIELSNTLEPLRKG